jgi:hypothetical protein
VAGAEHTRDHDLAETVEVEAFIARQRDTITAALLGGLPLRWERSLTCTTEQSTERLMFYGYDDTGAARLHLIFRTDDGMVDCVSVLRKEESDETPMSREAGERAAGEWLNRLGLPSGGVWEYAGPGDNTFSPKQHMVYSRWQTASKTAFVGIERRMGRPTFIRFRPRPAVQVGQRRRTLQAAPKF